jgi:hypothetical protein
MNGGLRGFEPWPRGREFKPSIIVSREFQNRASLPEPLRVIQKLIPSLHAPRGLTLAPIENVPIGVKSVVFQSDTLSPLKLVTSMRSPSNAANSGKFRPLPLSVAAQFPPMRQPL